MRYRAVIFDLFGTLVDNFDLVAFAQVMADMADAVVMPCEDFERLWKESYNTRASGAFASVEASIEAICQVANVRTTPERLRHAARIRLDFARRTLIPRSDAAETITRLKTSGCRIGLISDCTAEVPHLWSELSLSRLIDVPIFSCSVGLKKPDPRIYQLAWEGLEVDPQDCLYVGDGGGRELTGASQVGMSPVLIRAPHEDPPDPYRQDALDWPGPTITALKEVLILLD